MNKFMFIFRGGAWVKNGLSAEELQKNMEKWGAWMTELTQKGHLEAGQALMMDGLSIIGEAKSVKDGPYAEAKDLLTGFVIVKAKDMTEAKALSMGCPIFTYGGSLELRPVMEMKQ
jgi:hypothetical protein